MSKKKRAKQTAFNQGNLDVPPIEDEKAAPYVEAAILEVVENQIRANDPPETRQTLERLVAAGYERQQAVEMIGSAVTNEIWMVLREGQPFEQKRFVAKLNKLS